MWVWGFGWQLLDHRSIRYKWQQRKRKAFTFSFVFMATLGPGSQVIWYPTPSEWCVPSYARGKVKPSFRSTRTANTRVSWWFPLSSSIRTPAGSVKKNATWTCCRPPSTLLRSCTSSGTGRRPVEIPVVVPGATEQVNLWVNCTIHCSVQCCFFFPILWWTQDVWRIYKTESWENKNKNQQKYSTSLNH